MNPNELNLFKTLAKSFLVWERGCLAGQLKIYCELSNT